MQARHDRRTRWIVVALVIACGIAFSLSTTWGTFRSPPRWEIVPTAAGRGGAASAPLALRVAVLRVVDGALRVVPGSEVIADVPTGNALVVRRDAPGPVIRPRGSGMDVTAGPRLAVRARATMLTLQIIGAAGPSGEVSSYLQRELQIKGPNGSRNESGPLTLPVGGVAGPTLPTALPYEDPTRPPDRWAVPFRDEIVVVARRLAADTDAAPWTVYEWRAAVVRAIEQAIVDARAETSRRTISWFSSNDWRLTRLARLAALLQVTDALPALRELAAMTEALPTEPRVPAVARCLRTSRRALGDTTLTPAERESPPVPLGQFEGLGPCTWSLIARTTEDPDVAEWALDNAFEAPMRPPALAARDLLDAEAAGRLTIPTSQREWLPHLTEPPDDPRRLATLLRALVLTTVLAGFLVIVVAVSRRWRRSYVAPARPVLLLIAALVLASLDVPLVLGVLAPAPVALLAAAWLAHRLGADVPSGGTRLTAWAFAGAALLWVAGRVAGSDVIDALGRALEFGGLVLLLDAARRAEPQTLALEAPPRAPPRWTVPAPYVVLACLAGIVVFHEFGTLDPGRLAEQLQQPRRVALGLSVVLAAATGVWTGTSARSTSEEPPVLRNALGTWLAMLHVAALTASLTADNVDRAAAAAVQGAGGCAAVLFTLLVCLRLDTAQNDRAMYLARIRMIRAVRDVEAASDTSTAPGASE